MSEFLHFAGVLMIGFGLGWCCASFRVGRKLRSDPAFRAKVRLWLARS